MPRRMAEMSLALRIALATSLFGLVVIGCGGLLGYWALSHQLDQRMAAELHGKRNLLKRVLSSIASVDEIADNGHRFGDLLVGHEDLHLSIVDPARQRLLVGFSPIAAAVVALPESCRRGDNPLSWVTPEGVHLGVIGGMVSLTGGESVQFILAFDRQQDAAVLRGFVHAAVLGLPFLLLLVSVGAWLIARTSLAPLKDFNWLASSVSSKSLAQRITPQGLPAELRSLAQEFNAMLARIDDSVTRLQQFSGDLAHEMRTPVAILMGHAQVALSQARSAEYLHDVLVGNVDELERLTRLISDMLFLAGTENTSSVICHETVVLQVEAQRVVDYLSLIAEERGITVSVTGQAVIQADPLLVQRAITNLLSNAIRHAQAGSEVSLCISATGQAASLSLIHI